MRFCGVTEQMGDGSPLYHLPTNRPTWYLAGSLPGISQADFRAAIAEGFRRWGEVCDLLAKEVAEIDEAVEVITVADLGGGGTLADQQLPHPGMRQLRMRVNERIRWALTDGRTRRGQFDLRRVGTHELGHLLGFHHLSPSPPPDIMEPTYSDVTKPQAAESKIAAGWFGAPAPVAPPEPAPGETVIRIRGEIVGIDGYRVTKLG